MLFEGDAELYVASQDGCASCVCDIGDEYDCEGTGGDDVVNRVLGA